VTKIKFDHVFVCSASMHVSCIQVDRGDIWRMLMYWSL